MKLREIESGGILNLRHWMTGIQNYMNGSIKLELYMGIGQYLQSFNCLMPELNPFMQRIDDKPTF
jgi:hypothetical protein